jgi:hypothetical protein
MALREKMASRDHIATRKIARNGRYPFNHLAVAPPIPQQISSQFLATA